MNEERQIAAARALMELGVSRAGIVDLLAHHEIEEIEKQLAYLPLRKAKRPEAFIIDAIRHNYSAPNRYHYAKNAPRLSRSKEQLDANSQLPS